MNLKIEQTFLGVFGSKLAGYLPLLNSSGSDTIFPIKETKAGFVPAIYHNSKSSQGCLLDLVSGWIRCCSVLLC